MAARIRTLNFLPEIFQTPTNSQFLGATLDQIVSQPNTMQIEGYIGSKFGYGINAKDSYVVEPTKTRTAYQLDPGVVFTKTNTNTAKDFVSYPGIIDALKLEGAITNNNDRLFNSEFYSWDSFTNLDKNINFNQYYWLPTGAPVVNISTDIVYTATAYAVESLPNGYNISSDVNPSGATNPTLTLIRGGTYTFNINQLSEFWIQGKPGVTGYDPQQPNIQTRDVLGVDNNGSTAGIVTFTVPYKNAQDDYNFPGNNQVDVVSTKPFNQIDGQLLSNINNIDGVTSLEGLTVMFYDTGVAVDTFYTIVYDSVGSDIVIRLVVAGSIPTNQKITANYGTQWKARNFYRNTSGSINLIPYLSAVLDTLYYQDGTSANKVGIIRLIESNSTNQLDINTILGKEQYTSPNGVVFTNGLKVSFSGDIFPTSFKQGEYYVEGVGTYIELLDTTTLIAPEPFTTGTYTSFDSLPYDLGNFDSTLYIPLYQDYITVSRNSIDKNAWSRSNRWFHIDVINATATYNNNPSIATLYATQNNKAKRPIIEFYPNLRLFNNGVIGKAPIDFFDDRTTDAFSYVAGQEEYWPDVEVYTAYTAAIAGVTGTSTTITIAASDVTGTFQVGQYISDTTNVLPRNTQITNISGVTTITLTVAWDDTNTIASTISSSLIANDLSNDNYLLYDGARIVFSADTTANVKDKIYVVRFSDIEGNGTQVITLTEAENGLVLPLECTFAFTGYNNQGKNFYFDGNIWLLAQQKTTVNQAPYFDVFDNDGISFGNKEVYVGSSFAGNKLFSYGIGSGIKDIILGFPLRYSSVNNIGDISFDVSLNSSTFNYVRGSNPITQKVNTGYVYNYTSRTTVVRQLGWQTAVAESRQYQIFSFNYVASEAITTYTCDIAAATDTVWPNIQVYANNVLQDTSTYTFTITANSTIVNFIVPNPLIDTVVEITLLSDQVSATAYYQIPINLQNNPFNNDVTIVNVGDIRGQYQSIFYNNPNTTGTIFGSNNYRDLGNLVPWGTKIIQNSASLVLPSSLLRSPNQNLFNSLQYNSQQYINFKSLLAYTIDKTDFTVRQSPATILDNALDQITTNKTNSEPFFWSDMLPSKSAYVTNTYTFANSLDVSIYPLTRIYNFDTANYYGVLIYLTTTVNNVTSTIQLIINQDYIVSTDNPSLTITTDLSPGDIVTIREYNQTFGSYIPNTPTKLGLYPSFIPGVVLDPNYSQPTYFILGHDGSYTKLYGDYIDGYLIDFKDQALLEFETRIYNNLKLTDLIPVSKYDVIPGFFRTTDYSYDEVLQIYSQYFLNWVGQNRIEYKKQFYQSTDQYSYNYNQSGNKINGQAFEQGFWRGIYEYFYDTSTPNISPWEMIGFGDEPSWWTNRYGPAPYTSDNLILWGDMAAGINWNNGDPIVLPEFIREELLQVLPVDSAGNLLSPFDAVMGNYNQRTFRNDWVVGDVGPAEFSYRRSSSWPFDLMKILALTKPAQFFNLGFDVDNYKYSTEFNQYLVNNRSHLIISDVAIYGTGTAKTSYVNWIVDYEKQMGVNATQNITDLFDNLDVRLIYRLAGFSDKSLLGFYVEKGTPNSRNASLLIPDESYSVILYDNIPTTTIIYSGVIVQSTSTGWKVFGNSQDTAYFTTVTPKINGNYNKITVGNLSVQIANDYTETKTNIIPYGTEFGDIQSLSQFIASYGTFLLSQGVLFDQIESGIDVNWRQMITELLYWSQSGWEIGSLVNLNPAANLITINKDSHVVQPLTLQKQNFILNQNFYPIQSTDLSINRDSTFFSARPLNEGDTVAYGQFNISNFEHGIVFDNVTVFNDVLYNLTTGLRQNRILTRGVKSAEWNGTVDAQGFVLNQDNIEEWSTNSKYTRGSIVKYKNRYWFALKVLNAKEIFEEQDWKVTDYDEIQKGLLPNSSARSYESTLYYDTNKGNLDQDSDLLSWSLIGYRPRDYLALADLTDITQVNVYKNLIKEKGTRVAANNFKGLSLPQGGINYDIYDNWAIKTGEFGGVLNNNFVDFRLNQNLLTSNPSIVGLTNGIYTDGVQQEVPVHSIFNYGRPINSPNVLPTLPANTPNRLFPDAGYVNFNDVKISAYYYNGLNTAVTPLSKLYVNEYVWLADYLSAWQVYTPSSAGQVIGAVNNLNGTVTIQFETPHNLTKYQPFAIINFNDSINGYRIVSSVVDTFRVTILLSLSPSIITITGQGVAFKFSSQRVATPKDINTLPLLDSEFVKNKVWVDENDDGSWAVYRKSLNYTYDDELFKTGSATYGSAVALTPNLGYLVTDASLGVAYRYSYSPVFDSYGIVQTITHTNSFGSAISYSDNLFVISQPTGATYTDRKVYIYNLVINNLVNELQEYQVITAPNTVTNWGSSIAISGDQNWLYISAYEQNLVYVYRKSQLTGQYEQVTQSDGTPKTITVFGLSAGDNFGYSIATNYYGNNIVISSPYQDTGVDDLGYAYSFERLVQTFEAQYNSIPYTPQIFPLIYQPTILLKTASSILSNAITLDNVAGLVAGVYGTPVIFTGNVYSNVALNQVYYILEIIGSAVTLSLTRNGSIVSLNDLTGTMTMIAQYEPIYVSVNGTLIDDNSYAVSTSNISIYSSLTAGDIINVSGSEFIVTQEFTSIDSNPEVGTNFGYSLAVDTYANEILIGSPFEINNENQEGAVYRYTYGGGSYGIITGYAECNLTAQVTILINGYAVTIPAGNATTVANAIASANITNVTASASIDNILTIQVISIDLAYINAKLTVSVLDADVLNQLGIKIYTQTQLITAPHSQGRTQFGSTIKFNSSGSFLVSAPVSSRYAETTFDASDDENYDNDTLFDNNTTQFLDSFVNAGAVYMYDYLSVYNETVSNSGAYVYAQSVNALNVDYGSQPYYGTALEFTNEYVMIGTPNFRPGYDNGQVVIYNNQSGEPDWTVYRNSAPIVNTDAIQNAQLYSVSTNNTLDNLDYIDPLQGKILGAVRQNLDLISNVDPANYNSPDATNKGSAVWGPAELGKLWFDTSTTKFVNYHQSNDVVYNSVWWGRVFPGSDVTVYSWITSDVLPIAYQGTGTPRSIDDYVVQYKLNSTGSIVPVYYYWVRNTNIVFNKMGKTLSDTICESYISTPLATGISYMAPIQPNVFGLYNCASNINASDTALHIGFATGTNDDVSHSVYSLIRSRYADDFLPGLPGIGTTLIPESLYNKMLESFSGLDQTGGVVPDPYLPKPVQSGILVRPRQSFFYNRFKALENYLKFYNEVLSQYPLTETSSLKFLFTKGEINPSTVDNPNWPGTPLFFYNTQDYWEVINWWAPGYDNNTRAALLVESYYDLATINAQLGLIVTVNKNGDGLQETYVYDGVNWNRIGLQNGTIEFNSSLWDYAGARLGFGDNFFDTTPYDTFPSEETRYIIRSLNEELPSSLLQYRNDALILLFEYIVSETIESQNYLPWLNKTSFIDVGHTIRELLPLEVFQNDNQEFLSGYLNEVKPYHVVIKDFLFKYTGSDNYLGNITDFDLPAQYSNQYEQYITPELVYANPSRINQYLPTDPIWQTKPYINWFNNQGLSITGVPNYPITILSSYLSLNSSAMVVDNVYGFPTTGVILIGTEQIAYSSVDRAYSTLNGLTRGVNDTTISNHIPGEQIIIDLPPILLLNGGRRYAEPPKVIAYIDTSIYPAPRREAVLQVVMNLDTILRIDVVDPGDGYQVLPEIIIDPSEIVTFPSTVVDLSTRTITLQTQFVQTGDLIRYYVGTDTTPIGGLDDGQYYYLAVLESSPFYVVALYTTYSDALQDHDRIVFTNVGSGNNNKIAVSARASCVSTSTPIRENNIKLRFDRTTYTSRVTNWAPNNFYGSYYAGLFNNSIRIAGSSITLESTQPPIDTILASAQGATFQIQDVSNNQVLQWSSLVRTVSETVASNIITLSYSSEEPNASGSTIGFYVGMPIKFAGAVGTTNLVNNITYYVASIISESEFTISATVGGSTVVLNSEIISVAGLSCYAGAVTNTAIVTIAYPGILDVTATAITSNFITSPLLPTGTGGTAGFYAGLPVYFVGNVFGGIIDNETYYIITIIDEERFTISTKADPLILSVTATTATSNIVTVSSTLELNVNDPIIFTGTTFGGINAGQVYYIRSVVPESSTTITIASVINGGAVPLTTATGSCTLTSQTTAVQLTTATGNMTMNVGLPVSPGQVTGQLFTFYPTLTLDDTPYIGVTGTNGNLVIRDTVAATSNGNYLYLRYLSGGLTNIYNNLPFVLSESIGGLTAGTEYYVVSNNTLVVEVASSSSSTNEYTLASGTLTTGFYIGMPISFSGAVFGNVVELVTYFINSYDLGGDTFTITNTLGGGDLVLTAANGQMTLTADNPYVIVSGTITVDEIKETVFTQSPDTLSPPTFNVGKKLGGYSVDIINSGSGYTFDNTITISGADLGGTSPSNDLVLTVNGIDVIVPNTNPNYNFLLPVESDGTITSVIGSGTPAGIVHQYYLKVITATECEVYSDALMTVPINGITLETEYSLGDYVFLPEPFYFEQSIVKYNNKVWQCIISNNDDEFILGKWELMDSGDRQLNELDRIVGYYQPTVNMPGLDLTQLVSGITYPNGTYLGNAFAPEDQYTIDTNLEDKSFGLVEDTIYTAQGDPFLSGYGPEELVPGVISDNLSMIVTTRPGTDWDASIYGHVGFNVVSTEIIPSINQTVFSFNGIVENPASMALFDIDYSTNLSVRIYDFTVDWVNKTITLDNSLTSTHGLRIDLYEVGNGDQLVKSNSQAIPFIDNMVTGFVEMPLNCNYSASRFNGSGVIRPTTDPKQVIAIETDSLDNGIVCETVDYFVANSPIIFQGDVFGGITTDITYYVKTISYITNKITVSTSNPGGIAGPTFDVTSATGSMLVNIQSTNGLVWTAPILIHNGTNLVLGEQGIVSETKSGTNTIIVNSTDNYAVNDTITFSNAIDDPDGTFYDCGLVSQTQYYITSINGNEFTVSTMLGGSDLVLNDATGIALCVTNDYAITIVDQGITAKLVFSSQYNQNNDFVVLSIFGETAPIQYGYTVPEVQIFTLTSTTSEFTLTNFVGQDNADNAIVEYNGLRLTNNADYTINSSTNKLTLTLTPTVGSILSVTTYNLTDRQYLNTTYGGTFGGLNSPTVANIVSINNEIVNTIASTNISNTTAPNTITAGSTAGFVIGRSIMFKNSTATGFGNVSADGKVYYISYVDPNGIDFEVSDTINLATNVPGSSITVTTASGSMAAYVGGNDAIIITTGMPHNLVTNNIVRIDGVLGSTELNNNTYYAKVINTTEISLYFTPYNPTLSYVNDPVTQVSTYLGNGYVWVDRTFTLETTNASETTDSLAILPNVIKVSSTSLLIPGTPLVFTGTVFGGIQSIVNAGSFIPGNTYQIIETGTTLWTNIGSLSNDPGTTFVATGVGSGTGIATAIYYVNNLIGAYEFNITAVRDGKVYQLTTGVGSMNVTQWEQTNVDRLWVTVNGYRIPSSGLYLNPQNNLSILTTIVPTDDVIITNMIPTATPNETVYIGNVNKSNQQSIFRSNSLTRTWLAYGLQDIDDVIYVEDVSKVTESIIQEVTAPAVSVNDTMSIGLNGDKNIISQVIVYNNTRSLLVDPTEYRIVVENVAPILVIDINSTSPAIDPGDDLTVTLILGNLIYINGEQIRYTTVNFDENTLSGLQRGANGTGKLTYISKFTTVYGILSSNMLPELYNGFSWNSFNYNLVDGDPLQISTTYPANFLNTDVP